jgi:hypothetical protein
LLREMVIVQEFGNNFRRLPRERERFAHLVHTLVWAKEKTGKSSAEIIRVLLHKGKVELYRSFCG